MKRRDFLLGASATAMTTGTAVADTDKFYTGYPDNMPEWTAKHFEAREFASKGNGYVSVSKEMIAALDRVRTAVGHSMHITSGYRDPAHNRAVGGATKSRHLLSDAVDINLNGLTSLQRHALMWHLLAEGFTSFGSYAHIPNMLHADMRPHARIWHVGTGTHLAWFRRALSDWGWKRDHGVTRTPPIRFAQK